MKITIAQIFHRSGWQAAVLSVIVITAVSSVRADVVTDWNQITLATQAAISGGIRTPPASRALAMVHAAIYDSVNAIDRRYRVYAVDIQAAPGASPEAAAAAAAHAVLVSLYPSRQANLDAAYALSLSQIPNGASKTDGISLGESVAVVILALRSSDGSTTTLPYTQPPGPGIWQQTPLIFAPALFVAWGNVMPFALRSGSQFRAEGPPALTSAEYAADFNEVKSLGASNSATRTPSQTETARFWAENSQITWNKIASIVAAAQQNSLSDNARLFALLNLAGADTAIAVFDTKYTYNFWRPISAIRDADTDGNDDTIADPTWTPLIETPAHPDYTSQHSAFGAAAAWVLASFFDSDEVGFSITTSTAPGGVVRSYTSFSQAAEENMLSRIYIGYHFRSACRHGFLQGAQVGRYAFKHALQPAFDTCLQDDRSGDILRFNSFSGEYQFLRCGGDAFTLSGRGAVQRVGCVLTLADSKVEATINHCPIAPLNRGHAIVRVTPFGTVFVINDRDTGNSSCVCR